MQWLQYLLSWLQNKNCCMLRHFFTLICGSNNFDLVQRCQSCGLKKQQPKHETIQMKHSIKWKIGIMKLQPARRREEAQKGTGLMPRSTRSDSIRSHNGYYEGLNCLTIHKLAMLISDRSMRKQLKQCKCLAEVYRLNQSIDWTKTTTHN